VGLLAKQSALVTGAGRGIGKAIALRLAAEGARVTLTARTPEQLEQVVAEIQSHGGEALAVAADVADSRAVTRVVAAATKVFGPVSILINNAGVAGPFGPVGLVDPQSWWAAQQVHILGPFLFMHEIIPRMCARGGGRIVNIVSSAGRQPMPHHSAYAVGKSAAIRLSETTDLEQRGNGVRVFALHPGTIVTDMARAIIDSHDAQQWIAEGVAMLASRSAAASRADLVRCADVVAALATGRHDALAGRYLDINSDFPTLQ
jgi:NAD(P)-dependent dehydrogenase (short-subunit alcohol dehydrogenase family)